MTENARALSTIAADVRRTWPKVSPYAKPYLDAMGSLDNLNQNFYEDSAQSVVLYFLSNTQSWRGEDAKRIKAELKSMLNASGYKI